MTIKQPIGALATRSWNSTPISRRTTDGYVDATAMCRANSKRWKDYRESDRCQLYLDALESVAGISVHALVESRSGGAGGGGTWVHPQVAIDLARWISAPFAVWMDGWFLEELSLRSSPTSEAPSPVLPAERMLTVLERSAALMDRFGGVDERDQLLFRDLTRNTVLRAAGATLAPTNSANDELTLSDAWLEVKGEPIDRGKAPIVGRHIAQLYRSDFQQDPPKRTQYVDGAPRQVFSYGRAWLLSAISRSLPKHLGR
jgi:hypothetical protein